MRLTTDEEIKDWLTELYGDGEEARTIFTVIKAGQKFGYGNLISRLRDVWASDLVERYGGSYESARKCTNV